MGACPGCELLPSSEVDVGILYICPPLGHTQRKIAEWLDRHRMHFEQPEPHVLAVSTTAIGPMLAAVSNASNELLTRLEMENTKCLILRQGEALTIGDLARMETLQSLVARLRGEWLVRCLREQRLTSFFQPIVESERPDEVFAYECLLRGIGDDGNLVSPMDMYNVARDAKLIFHLDRASRLCHIRTAVRYELATHVFINFNPTAIYDPANCLRTTVQAIESSNLPANRFVFEVVESDATHEPERLVRILDYYREHGFLVALDDFGAGYGSVNLLTRLRPDFIKLDAHLIRGIDSDRYKSSITAKLLEMAQTLQVRTIAEGVETAEEYHWALRHGADYVQGYLFGRPAAIPERAATYS